MKELEAKAFEDGATPEALMEKVGRRMARCLLRDAPVPGKAVAYLGKGHNAGDALVVLRYLQEAGWSVSVREAFPVKELSELTKKMRDRVRLDLLEPIIVRGPLLLLDGLLGIGASGELRDPLRALALEMNELRESSGARVIAMDLPSGLNVDTGQGGAVIADHTLTVGVPKKGLVVDQATDFVGRISLIAAEELSLLGMGERLITRPEVRTSLPPRTATFHKGKAGRVSIIAGSEGLLGAAVLASTGSLRSGAGLITLWVPEGMAARIFPLVPPKSMVRERGEDWTQILDAGPDALVIGPGLGNSISEAKRLFDLLADNTLPVVLDADGINQVVIHRRHDLLQKNTIVTPHPGEMRRLHPVDGSRVQKACDFTKAYPATLLLKGARTIVTAAGEPIFYNTTGTPGMATGGQGDLLSGVIGALLAQGLTLCEAGCAGPWLTGRAAELSSEGQESLTPSDVAANLGKAFRDLRSGN